ncbi:MAG: hypothetical protein IH614_05185, partial [Desulfuromonadales bacterium]|nr:hypothetical protein [Desulfuromonadales bacterium]
MSDIIEEVTGGSGKFEYLTRAIAAISSLTLFLMMMLTAVSVGFRYFLNSPVAGDT